jgi:hypothetical protein
MPSPTWRRLPVNLILPALLCSCFVSAELFSAASSPNIQDGFINKAPTTCPVAQDGHTSNTFPWTHAPTCVNVVLASTDDSGLGNHQTFCVYTNSNYNNGRGISLVVSPEVAASVTSETFGISVGGLEGQIGEEMGMWEVKDTEEKGKGLFAKRDIAAIFAGESVIIQTHVLFISKQLLETPSTSRKQLVLDKAVNQLPEVTRKRVMNLDASHGNAIQDLAVTNGITVKWPWADEVPELLAIAPEVAVSGSIWDLLCSPVLTETSGSTMLVVQTPCGALKTTRWRSRCLH